MIPIIYTWTDDGVMLPLKRFERACAQQFVPGQAYCLVTHEERSSQSHMHYFSALREAFMNLPESEAERFPTVEHLRKYALIRAGFCDERSIVCASKAEAQRVAAFVKPMDEYAVVVVREATVKVFTAKSQSYRAMGKKDFQASKDAVLQVVSDMIGVSPDTIAREGARSAA